ncbi:MAG TPA: metallophosphoesterase [Ktedonobacteraceae bacterium]|nr:metallophosphoesterase [Ktedonobacteraceae bacterium]
MFADLHGYIELCFKLCARWEKETGERIDLILQTGDLGVFPDDSWLDWATRRHARRDPEEIGFMNYFARYDSATAATLQLLQSNLIFVRGNHEAHLWLDQREQQTTELLFPVDVYERLYCLKSGLPYTFRHNSEEITILGIGRIGMRGEGGVTQKPRHLQAYELERLSHLVKDQQIDILITHDAPYGLIFPDSGLHSIQHVLNVQRPLYHFFGHYIGDVCLEMSYLNHITYACKLAEPHFNKKAPGYTLQAGVMGLLRWTHRQQHHFELVDAPWLSEYKATSWRAL